MKSKSKMLGLTIATAAAIAFVTAPIASTVAQAKEVKCYGINSCKGQGKCKTAKNACKGQNSCKGQGFMMKSAAKCQKKGGSMEEPTS